MPFLGFENLDDAAPITPPTPREEIAAVLDTLNGHLNRLAGDGAEPSQIQDARTHLTAASLCIEAFLGPVELPAPNEGAS